MEYQYALRLTSEKRPPIFKNTFSNFRERVTDYYKKTGTDLIQQEVESLADLIREHLEIEGNRARIDSFMVSSSADAKILYDTAVKAGSEVTDTEEFELLKRMLGEQTD